VSSAGILIRAVACEILQSFHASCGVENQAGHMAIKIFPAKHDVVCIFKLVYGESPAVQLAGCRVNNFHSYLACPYFIDFFVHDCTSVK